jgi:hypothetical protein
VTVGHIDKLSKRILNYSGIDDEAVKSADNMLIKFRDVRNETGKGNNIFDRATTVIADYATKMNNGAVPSSENMAAASNRIGRALNDPIKGIGLLTRAGVKFTDQQKDQIKKMVAAHDTLGAQKIILGQLQKSYGGAAKAAGHTFAGQVKILQESFKNIAGEIMKAFMPALQHLLTRANKWITNAKNQKRVVDDVKKAFHLVVGGIKVLIGVFKTLAAIVGGNKRAIELLVAAYATWKILGIAGNVATLAGKFGLLATNTGKATTAVGKAEGASGRLSGSLLAKAGLVAAVGVASYKISKLVFHLTGLDKKFGAAGGAAYDFAAKLGLVHDPLGQFQGKTILSAAATRALRQQAARLEAGGLTPAQAAARISAQHPNLATRDVQVIAGVYGNHPLVVNGDVHVHGVQDPRKLQDAITKANRGRPVRRRGDP